MPPWADTLRADNSPGRHPPRADVYCSGRYASYWNAFLFIYDTLACNEYLAHDVGVWYVQDVIEQVVCGFRGRSSAEGGNKLSKRHWSFNRLLLRLFFNFILFFPRLEDYKEWGKTWIICTIVPLNLHFTLLLWTFKRLSNWTKHFLWKRYWFLWLNNGQPSHRDFINECCVACLLPVEPLIPVASQEKIDSSVPVKSVYKMKRKAQICYYL